MQRTAEKQTRLRSVIGGAEKQKTKETKKAELAEFVSAMA